MRGLMHARPAHTRRSRPTLDAAALAPLLPVGILTAPATALRKAAAGRGCGEIPVTIEAMRTAPASAIVVSPYLLNESAFTHDDHQGR